MDCLNPANLIVICMDYIEITVVFITAQTILDLGSLRLKWDGHPNTCSRQILLHGAYNNQCKVKTYKSIFSMAGG